MVKRANTENYTLNLRLPSMRMLFDTVAYLSVAALWAMQAYCPVLFTAVLESTRFGPTTLRATSLYVQEKEAVGLESTEHDRDITEPDEYAMLCGETVNVRLLGPSKQIKQFSHGNSAHHTL